MSTNTYFTSDTFTIPGGCQFPINISCQAGGGGGGGGGIAAGGNGGGGGGLSTASYSGNIGDILTITLTSGSGAGGATGSPTAGNGSSGSNAIVASGSTIICSANGGQGGVGVGNTGVSGAGGVVGIGNISAIAGGTGSGAVGPTGGGGGSTNGGKGGNSNANGSSGGNALVLITYTIITSSMSGNFTLYINTGCAGGLLPSGDVNINPSGHWLNSVGGSGGSGSFYPFVNTNPDALLADNDFIFVTQSGHLNKSQKIWYTFIHSSGYGLAYYDTLSSGNTLVSVDNNRLGFPFCHNKEGWIFNNSYINNNLSVMRDNSDYGNVVPGMNDSFKNINNSTFSIAMVADRKNKRIFFIDEIGGINNEANIYTINYDGTNKSIFYANSLPQFTSLAIDYRNNKLYASWNATAFATRAIYTFDLTTASLCTLDVSNLIGSTSFDYLCYDVINSNYYVANDNALWKVISTGSCSSGTITTIKNSTSNALFVDGYQQKLYYNTSNALISTSLSGTSPVTIATSGFNMGIVDGDGPGYASKIDFNLTDLPTGFGTTNTIEQVTNAYVTITGEEKFDFTNVYAKVLKPDLKSVIWENYPESCAQFPLASGKQKLNIGLTGSIINPSYNSLADWNGGILRLECYSLNDNAPSGNFKIYNAQVNVFCSGVIPSGASISNNNTLYMWGASGLNNNITLYIPGQVVNNGIPLYVGGLNSASGRITLYCSGSFPNTSLPLYLLSSTASSGNSSLPLYINCLSSSTSGKFNQITLYLDGNQEPSGSLPLYLYNSDTGTTSGAFTLYTFSATQSLNNIAPLYLSNKFATSGNSLYVKGIGYGYNVDGGPTGGYSLYGGIPLFINRPNIPGVMPLFLQNTLTSGGMSIWIGGANSQVSGMSLVIPTTVGSGINQLSLFTGGW